MKVKFKLVLIPCEHKRCKYTIEKNGSTYHPHMISVDNQIFIEPSNLGWVVTSSYGRILEDTRRPFILSEDFHLLHNGFSIEMTKMTSRLGKVFNTIKKMLGFPYTNLEPVLHKGRMVIIIDK